MYGQLEPYMYVQPLAIAVKPLISNVHLSELSPVVRQGTHIQIVQLVLPSGHKAANLVQQTAS